MVTTHSPFIVSRAPRAQVVALNKGADGVSHIEASASGSESQAPALTGLFRDSSIPDLLDRSAAIPKDADAVLLVEGTTDRDFLRTAARLLGLEGDMKRIHILPTAGTDNLVAQAVVLRAEANQAVWTLVDSDDNGRKARDSLTTRFGFPKGDVLEYRQFANNLQDAESEWLFPGELLQRFVDAHGEEQVLKSKHRHGGEFRYDFTPVGKDLLPGWLSTEATETDMSRWRPVLDKVVSKLS
jgi:predicted ATP-dependent endonuclease of OLD family